MNPYFATPHRSDSSQLYDSHFKALSPTTANSKHLPRSRSSAHLIQSVRHDLNGLIA